MRTASFATLFLSLIGSGQASAQTVPPYLDFKGRALVVVSDADMVASAYVDGDLGPRHEGLADAVSIIPLGRGLEAIATSRSVSVSNAVTAWPNNLALAPDGRWAVVAELGAPAPAAAKRFDELRPARGLALLDLSDPAQPRVTARRELEATTVAAAVHPNGKTVAVALRGAGSGKRLALLQVEGGQMGKLAYLDLPGATSDTPHLEWHPSGRFLAATFAETNEVRFYELVGGETATPTLRPWGKPVAAGLLPGVGYFTPDGRQFLLTNLYWGGGVAGTYLGTQAATLMAIAFDATLAAGAEPNHLVVSSAAVGGSPENFAISPDGGLVVSLNMDQSYAPTTSPHYSPYSSLTLLTLDKPSGRLTPVGTYRFDGILPEGITFDASGRYLAVANFQHRNPHRSAAQTTVDYWEVVQTGGTPALLQLDFKTPVPRGAHIVKLAR